MPLTSGLGRHDNTKHVGSAKAGVPGGVAQLDSTGSLTIPGSRLQATRSDTDDIEILDLTSFESPIQFRRLGSLDWTLKLLEGGSRYRALTNRLFNIPNGIPQLSSEGRIETALLPVLLEEYTNHSGTLDNFTIKNTAGSGSVSEDSLTHSIKITSGDTYESRGGIELGDSVPVDKNVTVFQCKVRDYTTIPDNYNSVQIGFSSYPSAYMATCTIAFSYKNEGTWEISLRKKNGYITDVPVSVAKGDILTVEIYNNSAVLFINGDQVYAAPSNILEGNMTPIIMAHNVHTSTTTPVNMYVDAISLKRYKGR